MFPILFNIGPITIRTYGVLLAIGFAAALGLAALRAKKRGISPDLVLDLGFYMIVAGILGARLFYILQYPDYYFSHPLSILKIWEGGLVFYGGLAGGILAWIVYLKLHRTSLLQVGDLFAPSVSLGQAIGRLGCFSAGCCYGKPFSGSWAVTFHDSLSLAPLNTSLHPVQIYLSLANFIIFLLLLAVDRRRTFHGQTLLSYLILYSAARIALESFRGDDRGFFFTTHLSTAQGIGIVVIAVSVAFWIVLARKGKASPKS